MFLVRPQAAAGAADDFWYQPIGVTSASGASVTPISSMRLSVVYACVRVLSESVAKLPVRMYRGEFDEAADHPLARLLRRKPNPWQTSFEFREMMQAHLCLRGKAFAQIVYGGSQVAALVPCHPDRVDVEQVADTRWRYRVRDWQGRERVVLQEEMLHLKLLPMDGFTGLSTIDQQREPIGTALSAQDYQGRFFRNGARHSGLWIEAPGKFANSEDRAKFREAFRAGMSGENAYTTPVLDQGMKLHELGMTNADAQFIESRKYSDSDLCRMFLVPPHMVGILDRATNNNIEYQGRSFYNDTLMGLLRRWEEALEGALLTADEQDEGLRIEFDVDEIVRADMKTRGESYSSAIQAGWMTPNEARRRERMAPLPGLDEPLSPLNMTTPGQRGAADAPDSPDSPQDGPPADRSTRERALLGAAADRCVTREVNAIRKIVAKHGTATAALELVADFYGTHAGWMARALSVSEKVTASICEARFDELRENPLEATLERWAQAGGALLLVEHDFESWEPVTAAERRHAELVAATARLEAAMRAQPAPVVNLTVPERPVTVEAPQVTVGGPTVNVEPARVENRIETSPPVVNVEAPRVSVAAPSVTVEPVVNVDAKVVAESDAPDGMPWTKQTTVDKVDAKGRPLAYTTRPVPRR